MKKKLLLVLLLVFAITLTGCGESKENKPAKKAGEKEVVCTLKKSTDQGTIDATYTLYYEGKYVTRVYSYEEVESDSKVFLEAMKQQVEESYENASKYGGYEYSVKVSGNKVTSTANIDYSEMDLEKYAEDVPGLNQFVENGKFTVEGAKKIYTIAGATCK